MNAPHNRKRRNTLDGENQTEAAEAAEPDAESPKRFAHELGDRVNLAESPEQGEVIGRCEFKAAENSYLVRYLAGDGRQVESWWGESALKGA